MSSRLRWLALWLDAPLQSWGFESRFERRRTGLFPTKSGVLGLICAAMGVRKGSRHEQKVLDAFAAPGMAALRVPRWRDGKEIPTRRVVDYHTVLGPRTAKDPNPQRRTVQSWREYIVDARFVVLLPGKLPEVEQAARKLQDPVWGVWLGRKCCVASAPVVVSHGGISVFADEMAAWKAAIALAQSLGGGPENFSSLDQSHFTRACDSIEFKDGTDLWNDDPVCFGRADSSGVDARQFRPRRVFISASLS